MAGTEHTGARPQTPFDTYTVCYFTHQRRISSTLEMIPAPPCSVGNFTPSPTVSHNSLDLPARYDIQPVTTTIAYRLNSTTPQSKAISTFSNHTIMPPQSSTATASNRKRKILPMARSQDSTPSSPSLSESSSLISDDGDEEYAPEPARSTRTAKRPRDNDFKSSTGGRSGLTTNSHGNGNRTGGGNNKTKGKGMSREQLRKVNHSLIERRRREKINAALNELRRMVPGLGENGGKCGEFKLEVSIGKYGKV